MTQKSFSVNGYHAHFGQEFGEYLCQITLSCRIVGGYELFIVEFTVEPEAAY